MEHREQVFKEKDIMVYHVDKIYGMNGEIQYVVFPYSLIGTLKIYFGFSLRNHRGEILYYPWYLRFTGFAEWLSLTRLSSKRAKNLANKMSKQNIMNS